ncbi:MAG: carboxypeptidase-like regulatory domain-containing protein [DPANN group archaeon]|nr:carboxypeptidase-like regulatory domain-containing protein [DPANN group archaeon]
MKKNIAFTILTIIALAIIIPYIFAASNYIEGTVISIETGNPIGNVTIDIVNCTNQSQILNSTTTYTNGTFKIEYNNTWGQYLINASGNSAYYEKQFKNNTQCFENGTNLTLKLYPLGSSSLNITLTDTTNGRPIPDAIITLYKTSDNTKRSQTEYICPNNICKTKQDGTIIVMVDNPGTYKITIESNDYNNWNETLTTFNESTEEGKNRDYTKQLQGSSIISGKVTDFYNNKNIEGAIIELYEHDSNPYSGENLSFEGIYNYTTTTNSEGIYILYIPSNLITPPTDNNNYDISAKHKDWTQTINYNGNPNTNGGWHNPQLNLNLNMKGILYINGSITDCNNNEQNISLDIYITDKSGNGFNYYTHTDNGNFSIFVKNTTTGYDGYNITINGTQYNAITLANTQQDISVCVDGSQKINGTVIDAENNLNLEDVTVIINLNDGNRYNTTTDSNGIFDMDIKDNIEFSIDIAKSGYTGISPTPHANGNYGIINLTGAHHIIGSVEDKEGSRRTAGARIENVIVNILNQTTHTSLYTTKTDINGDYSINIPSNINYTLSLNKNHYNPIEQNLSASELPNNTLYLQGTTHIDGHILDASNYAVNKNITLGSTISFADISGTQYQITSTESTYSIDMAIDNYNITVSKAGYDTQTYIGESSGSYSSKDINLKGSLNMTITTTNNFSNQSISLVNVRLFTSGNIKYDNIATLDGTKNIFVNSEDTYYIAVYHNNYLPIYEIINTDNITFEKEYRLIAKYETKITDAENNLPIENAQLQAYHYFNQTYYLQQLNETTLEVTVNCSGMLLNNINVTITGSSYSNSQNTISGATTFAAVPIDTYNVEANGSIYGCRTQTTSIDITQGGTAYNTTILLNTTILMINLTNPLSQTIYPANVTYENSTGANITMQSFTGLYYDAVYIALGNYNTTVNESNHYTNTVQCNVTIPGEINWCNITLQPRPGNISIYIINETGTPIDNTIINITNSTDTYQISTTGGWANFTNIESVWNLTINAIDKGYQNQSHADIYAYPNNNTTYTFTLNATNLTINITDDLGILQNANVSLTDPTTGTILRDYLGNSLNALTDTDGIVTFTRFNQSTYNITINETSHDFYNQTIILSMDSDNNMLINLDTTRMTVNVIDTYSTLLANIYVSLNKTDGAANFTGYTNSTGTIILENQTFPPGLYNLTINGTSLGYNYTEKQINIYGGSQNTENAVLEEYRLNIQVNSSYDNAAAENINVTIEEIPSSKNTDNNGTAQFRNLENKTYTITINGTDVGYNATTVSINVTGSIIIEILLEENTFKIEVIDEEGSAVSGGIDVILWETYPTLIYDDALGDNLIGETNTSNNNITFRKMQYEASPGQNITMTANGSAQGYGITQTNYTIFNGTNGPNTTMLNITQILVNVTDAISAPVIDANVTLLDLSGGFVNNGKGLRVNGTTVADGTVTLKWIIPGTYNISITKNVSGTIVYNSTLITISAGEHKYIHLDPNNTIIPSLKGTYYNSILENDTYDLIINTTGLAGPVENITVKIYATGYDYSDSYWYNYEATDNKTTDANGIIVISNLPSGVYDVLIDGESKGYGITKTKISIGKLVFSKGTTNSDGIIVIPIDGSPINNAVDEGYFIRITTAGYKTYDSYDNGQMGMIGTYYDQIVYDQNIYPGYSTNNRTNITINGIINLIGHITDLFFVNTQSAFKNITNAFVEFIIDGTETVRYTTYSDENGNYSINVSPILQGATNLDSPLTYKIRTTQTGYNTNTVKTIMTKTPSIITTDISLSGNSKVNGTIFNFDGGIISSNILVIYLDNSRDEIYRTTTDENGIYSFKVNPHYKPYILSFSDNESNILYNETQAYTEPHLNEDYYLLGTHQAILNMYILDDYNAEIETAAITIESIAFGDIIEDYTNENGRVNFFIDGNTTKIGAYKIIADGTTLGYGNINENIIITAGYNPITLTIKTTKINLSLTSNLGNSVHNTTVTLTGNTPSSISIENDTATFSKIISGNYIITFESDYFIGSPINIDIDDINAGTTIQTPVTLNESRISIRVINQTGDNLENISITVNGPTSFTGQTDTNGWFNKTQILKGNYNITFTNTTEFTDNNYFIPQKITITQTIGNTTYIEVTAIERIINITVNAYDLKDIYNTSKTQITNNTITVSLTNNTGLTLNKTGDPNTIITTNSIANFTDLYDSIYRINASSINYTSDNETTFNTTATDFNTEQDIYLKQNDMAYINITILSETTPISGAQTTLYWNATTLLTNSITDAQGRVMLQVNATAYNETLHLIISKTGFITTTTIEFNITVGETYNNITQISLTPLCTTCSSSSSRDSPSAGFSAPTTITPTKNNTYNTTDTDSNDNYLKDITDITYTYNDNNIEIKKIINNNLNIYSLLEKYFGKLSETDILSISQDTEKIGKYIEITRDITLNENGNEIIGINTHYTGNEVLSNFAIYETLPTEIITTDNILFTDTSAKIIIDKTTNSYLIIYPRLEPNTYIRTEYKTDRYINPKDIIYFSKPKIFATDIIYKNKAQSDNTTEITTKKSILDYWWLMILAALTIVAGIFVKTKTRQSSRNYSFKPIETTNPMNPPYIAQANTMYNFEQAEKVLTTLPKQVLDTINKTEQRISQDIKEVAHNEVAYLAKKLEKERFIVD